MTRGVKRDDLDLLLEWGLHLPTRTLYLGALGEDSSVDYQMAALVIKSLHILESVNHEPITIIMNTTGGDIYHCRAIYDAIRRCHSTITFRGTGYVMSAGALILQAADKRQLTENARVMIHYGSQSTDSDQDYISSVRSQMDWKQWADWQAQVLLGRIRQVHQGYRLKQVRDLLKHDTYLSAQEAVELGLADEVI